MLSDRSSLYCPVSISDRTAKALCFFAGLSVGAAVGLIVAPAPGKDTRRYLSERAGSAREYVGRSRELYEMGCGLAEEAAQLYEEGRHLVEDTNVEG